MNTTTLYTIRPAQPNEAQLLTDLTVRSKGHWGYSEEWMTLFRPSLELGAAYIWANPVFVADEAGVILGYYSLASEDMPEASTQLDLFFIDPPAIGRGVGRALFNHAIETAQALGYTRLFIEADPNAEGFYETMGAVRISERHSTLVPGRTLPWMRYDLG